MTCTVAPPSSFDMLVSALYLALTAPTDEKAAQAIEIAESIAQGKSAKAIEAAKAKALNLAKKGNEQ